MLAQQSSGLAEEAGLARDQAEAEDRALLHDGTVFDVLLEQEVRVEGEQPKQERQFIRPEVVTDHAAEPELDGVYDHGADGALRFFQVSPKTEDIEALVERVGLKCERKRMTLRTIVIGAPASTTVVSGLLRARAPPEGGGAAADRGA